MKRNDGGTGIYINFQHVLKEQFKTQELILQSLSIITDGIITSRAPQI